MKAIFLIIVVVSLALGGNSFAVSHGNVGGEEKFQPTPPSELIIDSSEFAEKENLEILLQKIHDRDPFVRVEAVQALGKIGRLDVALTLLRLLPALDDPSPYVRAVMVAALGELQEDERAVDSVRKLLSDEDESVRKMAAWALNKIENSQ